MTVALCLAAAIMVAMTIYILGAGADFGAGIWDLLATGARKKEQRRLIENAMGPVWEANHVWLIFATVLLFSGFPRAFADIATTLHVPLTLFLFGVVLRGAMFTFRHYDIKTHARFHGTVFATSSIVAPFFLGVCAAMLSMRQIDPTSARWFTPFTVTTGLVVVALCAHLAAVYLAWESDNEALANDFKNRAGFSFGLLLVLLAIAVGLAKSAAPAMLAHVSEKPLSCIAITLACVNGTANAISIRAENWRSARVFAALFTVAILTGWASQRAPFLLEPFWTIATAGALPASQQFLLIVSILGMVLLIPSLWLLFRIFKTKKESI